MVGMHKVCVFIQMMMFKNTSVVNGFKDITGKYTYANDEMYEGRQEKMMPLQANYIRF